MGVILFSLQRCNIMYKYEKENLFIFKSKLVVVLQVGKWPFKIIMLSIVVQKIFFVSVSEVTHVKDVTV